jgi:hypothetical protein
MTGQANEQAAVNYPPPPATRPADADTYDAAVSAATRAVAGLTDPVDRSQLAWSLAAQFCLPEDYYEAKAEIAEDAILDAIRARPTAEHADILNRAADEFTAPGPIAWSDLVWAVVLVVLVALVLVRAPGLTDISRGAVLGCGLSVAAGYAWSFATSVFDHFREKHR